MFWSILFSLVIAASPAMARFTYDSRNGRCQDEAGRLGRNPFSAELLQEPALSSRRQATFAGRDAECVDLSQVNVHRYAQDHAFTGYTTLRGWNLRGALLAGTDLRFTVIEAADLAGADVSKAVFGYTSLSGVSDAFTLLPSFCANSDHQASCRR